MPTTPTAKPARLQLAVTIDADLAAWRMVGVAFLVERALRDLRSSIPSATAGLDDNPPPAA